MDRNFLFAIALSFVVLTGWTMYERKMHPTPVGTSSAGDASEPHSRDERAEGAPTTLPSAPAPEPRSEARKAADAVPQVVAKGLEERIRIRTDLYDAELSSHGGGLTRFELLRYDDPSRAGRPQVDLVTAGHGDVVLATAFGALGLGDLSRAGYEVERPNPLTVVFTRKQGGIQIRKTYLFKADDYLFRLRLEVDNGSDHIVEPTFRVAWPAVRQESADYSDYMAAAFTDGDVVREVISSSRSFFGMGGKGFDKEKLISSDVEWAGVMTRYFVAAIFPEVPAESRTRFDPIVPGKRVGIEIEQHKTAIPPGQHIDREYRIYLGPKEPVRLGAVGAHFDQAIRGGWFPSLTAFFTRLLTETHKIIPNYGVAIILITIVVRLLMAPLMARQMRSMKRMSALQPKVKELQAKYPDDKQKQSEAMMSVYKEAGVNPLAMMTGCLPMFLQMPVFLGFYYALQGAIQLRQQPFVGWINDLSMPETLFVLPRLHLPVRVLPLLMGGAMVLQQKMTPSSMDPNQARMMMTVMPVMFTFMFYQFASGLVLYWLVSTLLGILQQVVINRNKS